MHRLLFIFTTLLFFSCSAEAKSKKTTSFFGFQLGYQVPKYSASCHQPRKLGIPSFSYAASLEQKFSSKRRLSFSTQYALRYSRQIQYTPNNIANKSSEPSSQLNIGVQVQTNLAVTKKTNLFGGIGVQQPIVQTWNTTNTKTITFGDEKYIAPKKPSYLDAYQAQPYFLIGVENSIKLFNRSLYYSIQYNIGFFPFRQNNYTITPSTVSGVQIGIKYKL